MNDGVEQPSIPPGGGEVITADAHVALGHLLRPHQQTLLGRHVLGLSRHMDFRDLWKGQHDDFQIKLHK